MACSAGVARYTTATRAVARSIARLWHRGIGKRMRVERRGRVQPERRVLIGGIAHETNVFSTVPTDLDQFRQRVSIGGRELITGFAGTRTVVGGFLDGLAAANARPVPLIYASATPGG